jgi:hypothetical protein
MPHEVESEGSRPQTTVDTAVWKPGPNGHLIQVRVKSVREVFEEIVAVVGDGPAGAEEYFSIPSTVKDVDREWPAGLVFVFAVTGASEGHYVHVEVLNRDGLLQCVMLGKTFQGKDAAWAFARRLADLLEV